MLDPDLIKAGTKEMIEMSETLERKALNGIEKHNTLLHYYNQSGLAKQKAAWYATFQFKIANAHHLSNRN